MNILGIDIESTKMAKKLRAIAKHAEQLADELDAIDNAWQCECGSFDYTDLLSEDVVVQRACNKCNEQYAYPNNNELPSRLEGSE